MSTLGKTQISYVEAFTALARYIAQEGITDVCVMDFEGGVIVSGSKLYTTGEGLNRHIATRVFSNNDLVKLIKGGKSATTRP